MILLDKMIEQWKKKEWSSREQRNSYERENRKKNRVSRLASAETWPIATVQFIRHRAKQTGIPFTITAKDIPVPDLCPALGVPFAFGSKHNPRSPSVDRIRPELGYVPGNVRVITRRANAIKYDSVSSSEVLAVALYMEREGL